MDVPEAPSIRSAYHVGQREPGSVQVNFKDAAHIYVVKKFKLVPPIAVAVHVPVGIHDHGQTGNDERRERELLAGPDLMFADELPRVGDIHLYQAIDGVLPMRKSQRIEYSSSRQGNVDDPKSG